MKTVLFFAICLLFLLPLNSLGGWLLTGVYIDKGGNAIPKRYFIENNQVKVETMNYIYSCNLNTGRIVLVDPENLVYTITSLDAYKDKMRELKLKRLNELLALIPEDQRAANEYKYKAQVETELTLPQFVDDSITVVQFSDSIKIAVLNLVASHYKVDVSGQLREEFLFSDKVNLSAVFDQRLFLEYLYLLEPEDKTVLYRTSEKYQDKVTNGVVVGRIIYENGLRSEWQVKKIEKKTIPDYEFDKPALCKELTLDKWLTRNSQVDDRYYDDYE